MLNHSLVRSSTASEAMLSKVKIVDGEFNVQWVNRPASARFSAFWLRDNCHARHSLNADTLQRQVDTFAIPDDIAPADYTISDGGRTLTIRWQHADGVSVLPAEFLWHAAQDGGSEALRPRSLWDRASVGEAFPTLDYAKIMADDAELLRWLTMVEGYGFALASGVPQTQEATERLVTRIGYVRQTLFGAMWGFSANMAFKDTAYTSAAIGPHTDGTYSNDAPGFQMFHCLKFEGSGGDSTLVDGFNVAEEIRRSDPRAFEVLTSVRVPAQYLGDGVHLRAEHPIINLDERGELRQIAYNNYDRAAFRLPTPRMNDFYRALKLFNQMINDPVNEITMRLLPGTALLFDNWRTLHGRRAYRGQRWLCGAYLNKEDFDSKLRVLRAAETR